MYRATATLALIALIPGARPALAQSETEAAGTEAGARLYTTPQERREAGRERRLTPWLSMATLAEVEWTQQRLARDGGGQDRTRDGSAGLQLGLTATPLEWAKAELILQYDTDIDKLEVDEATVSAEHGPWELTLGKQFLPFGVFFSHFVSGPILEFGETRQSAGTLAWGPGEEIDLSLSLYRGSARKVNAGSNRLDWALALESWPMQSLSVGTSFLSDLADSDDRLLSDERDRFERKVPAASAYLVWVGDTYELTVEALGATRSFQELDRDRIRPMAWNLEFAHFPHPSFDWAIRLEGSRELEDAPRLQGGVAVTFRVGHEAALTLEVLHGRFKGALATDDQDNPYESLTRLGALLSIAL